MYIPLVDLARIHKRHSDEIEHAAVTVLRRGDYVLGRELLKFENQFAKYTGSKYCVGVANGTDAIKLSLIAAGTKPGDEVVTQANTFISTILPILELGAKPILVDCHPESGIIDVRMVKTAISKRTRAIIPVHLFGYPAPIEQILKLPMPKDPRPTIIEDAAQAQGVMIDNQHAGTIGDFGCFSFYPGKNLGADGDAGAIITNNVPAAEKLRILRNIGQDRKYHHLYCGVNSRLDTVQAAILSVKLKYLNKHNDERNQTAKLYLQLLKGVGDLKLPPLPPPGSTTNWHLFVVRTDKRDGLQSHLTKHGIQTGIHYPIPLHLQPSLANLKYKKGDFPNTESRADTMLSIPIFPGLTEKEINYIAKTIKAFYV